MLVFSSFFIISSGLNLTTSVTTTTIIILKQPPSQNQLSASDGPLQDASSDKRSMQRFYKRIQIAHQLGMAQYVLWTRITKAHIWRY